MKVQLTITPSSEGEMEEEEKENEENGMGERNRSTLGIGRTESKMQLVNVHLSSTTDTQRFFTQKPPAHPLKVHSCIIQKHCVY